MISGMLTAIRDFVQDSFGVPKEDTLDALQVVNELSRQSVRGLGESVDWAVSADRVIADLDDEEDDLLWLLAADLEQQRAKSGD